MTLNNLEQIGTIVFNLMIFKRRYVMKKLFSRMFNSLPKRLAAGALIALAFALPVAVTADQMVAITATTGVANVTAGDTTYNSSINATYDQVIKVQVLYNNTELLDSGLIAQNLKVAINIPTTPGAVQNITTTTSAGNSNSVSGNATVNLGRTDAYLQYIPGSAVWAHAVSPNSTTVTTQTVSDAVVSTNGLVLENENPCQAGGVTVLARVMVPGVRIVKQSEVLGQSNAWSANNTANPGDTLKYMITYQNIGNTPQNSVVIRDSLPPKMVLVPNSTILTNSTNPTGVLYNSDNITNGGIVIGNYAPGAGAFIVFEVKVPDVSALACNANVFNNVGVAQPSGLSAYFATANTTVNKPCANNNSPTCNSLTVTKTGGRGIEAVVNYSANGATFQTATYNFGDNTTPLTTNKTDVTYTYAKDATYNVSASLVFSVNGVNQTVSSATCTQTVNFTTPTQLPNTGAGDTIGLFTGATVVGGLAYRLFLARRFARQ